MANKNFSAKDIHVFTLYLSRARMIFSEELSSEERMPLPSSIVDGKEAIAVMKAFLETDTATQQTIDDSNYVNPEDVLDEIFEESDNSEKLEILSQCYSVTGLFSKIYEFNGSGQGDFITVLSAAPSEARAADSAYEVEDMAFPPEDDEIYESSGGRDGHVYTIVKSPAGGFKYDASLSSSYRLPYPDEVLENVSDDDVELIVQEFGGSVGGRNPNQVLETLFDESNIDRQLHILEECFKVSGAGYTQIYHPYDGEDEIYILAVAASKGQANQRAMDVIHMMNDRIRDREDED